MAFFRASKACHTSWPRCWALRPASGRVLPSAEEASCIFPSPWSLTFWDIWLGRQKVRGRSEHLKKRVPQSTKDELQPLGLSGASRSARAASAALSAALAAILESYCNTTEMQPPMMSKVPKAVNAVLELDFNESTIYRSLVGMAIYLAQERLDTSFTVKELASKMSKPTITAMSRLKKVLGYLKQTIGLFNEATSPRTWARFEVQYQLWLRLGKLQWFGLGWQPGSQEEHFGRSALGQLLQCLCNFAEPEGSFFVQCRGRTTRTGVCSGWCCLHTWLLGEIFVAGAWSTTPWWTTRRPSRLPTRKVLGRFDICQGRCCGSNSFWHWDKRPLSIARTKALLYCTGMVEGNYAVGEAECEEMARKHETGKKIKAMAKTLVNILAVSSLEGAHGYKLVEDDKFYEIDGNKVTENDFVAGAA